MILTADELKALGPLDRQAARRAARQQPLVRLILLAFVRRGGPIPVEEIVASSPERPAEEVHEALVALDADDLIRIRAGQIDIAYPFSGLPSPFRVRLPGGRERHACCAMDALGIAPMLGEPIEIESRCHHCDAPLVLAATPDGPGAEAQGLMVWFGQRADERGKVADAL